MKLRPHHLLCTQGYSGKGYNDAFVKNMTAVTNCLRNGEDITVDIVFITDDICKCCPNRIGSGLCKDNDKVTCFDDKVIRYFGLKEKRYIYRELVRQINAKMTSAMLQDICAGCSWYPVSACRKNILGSHFE